MSSRQLRKLQQQRELEAQAKLAQSEQDSDSDSEPVASTKPKASLFANFAALEDDGEEADEPDEEQDEKVGDDNNQSLNDPAPTTTTKKSKKSKKKKKSNKKGNDKGNDKSAGDDVDGEDEIDAALKQLAVKQSSSNNPNTQVPSVDPEYERVCRLLGINSQHLKVANEMRNLFGRTAVDNHDEAGGRVRGNRRQRGAQQQVDLETALKGHHAPGKGLSELTLRRNNFIQGKDDWPRGTTGGLTMEMVDDKAGDGTVEFRYAHNKTYQELQRTFRGYVEMGDPQNLIGLLTRNPYHISLLIQVSKIAKDQGDHALSSDLLERALFSFGRASLSQFNSKLLQGKARLDFARPENRELWLAGYQYIKSLIMKGTYRTAFEWAKLLLSLDPEGDPYCMRLMIHHLALRAHEFNWLLDVGESKIPMIWSHSGQDESQAASHTTPSLAFAALQLREGVQSRRLLTKSMEDLPWLFARLFKELSLDAPPSIWGTQPRTDAETLFTEIYVLQTKDLWNTPEATSLLMEIAHTIKSIDVDTIAKLPNQEMTLDVVRFVYLDNAPALMAMAPSQLLHRDNNSDSDPLPPDSNIFSYDAQRAWVQRGPQGTGGLGGDFLDPMAALARLIPGFRPGTGDSENDGMGEERLRRGLEDAAREESGENGEAESRDGQPALPRSVARRLLDMLGWGSGSGVEESDSEDEFFSDQGSNRDDETPEVNSQNGDHDGRPRGDAR